MDNKDLIIETMAKQNADPCPAGKPSRDQPVHRDDHIHGVEVRPKSGRYT